MVYLVIPKVQIFTKFLYNLSDDWLENVVLSHSYLFSTHHYLYMSSVIFGNMAINSFCTSILLIISFNTPHITRNLTVLQLYKSLVCIFYAVICRRVQFGTVNIFLWLFISVYM